jgi:hypothetical protein
MKSPLFGFAVALVRAWTRLYTWRMEPALRETRREEIESDLWEFQHDSMAGGSSSGFHVLARLFLGVPSDLCWRVDNALSRDEGLRGRAALTTAAAVLVAALWIVPALFWRNGPLERTRANDCPSASTTRPADSLTRADYRMQVINCAGAFFGRRGSGPPEP